MSDRSTESEADPSQPDNAAEIEHAAQQQEGQQQQTQQRAGKPRHAYTRPVLLVVLPLLAIIAGLYLYFSGGRYVTTENAYVRANIIAISADVDGRVVAVNVSDNDRVSRNAELFRLDPQPFALKVLEAEAEMRVAGADFESLRAEYREAVASIDQARQQVSFLKRQLERQDALIESGVVSAEKRDEAQHELKIAQQRIALLTQRARGALANLGGNSDITAENHPAYQRAQSRLNLARTQQQKTIVYAPDNGVVSNVRLQAGEYVRQGDPVFSLIDTSKLWVEANLKETQLTHLREGQRATLTIDAYPDIEWDAVVSRIAPATGAEFSLLPPQNATGNWVKVVQRVPVVLQLAETQNTALLRAGMTVSASIDTQRSRSLPKLLDGFASDPQIHQQPSLPPVSGIPDISLPPPQFEIAAVQIPQPEALNTNRNSTIDETLQRDSTPVVLPRIPTPGAAATRPNPAPVARHLGSQPSMLKNDWLFRQNQQHFTIQVSRSTDTEFLSKFATGLPADEPVIRYRYKSTVDGKPEYGLATGLYSSREHASNALRNLPPAAKRYGPWLRQLNQLRGELAGG